MNQQREIIPPNTPRGMRDTPPERTMVKQRVNDILRGVFELYGFSPLETPAMERLEILAGKGGVESDKLSFMVLKRGAEFDHALDRVKSANLTGVSAMRELADMGLRYDLTVPLARFTAMNRGKLTLPFKRFQIGPVWRAERPQQGRYREFTQCDIDIVGTDSITADVEIISILIEGLKRIENEFEIGFGISLKINHRGILEQASAFLGNKPEQFTDFCVALDKLDKIGREGVEREMSGRGLTIAEIDKFWNLVKQGTGWGEDENLLAEMLPDPKPYIRLQEIAKLLSDFTGVNTDFSLARGLDYYTGVVFEVTSRNQEIGSICGGGRYDGLVSAFSKKPLPAVGASFGIERIVDLIEAQGPFTSFGPKRVSILFEGDEKHYSELANFTAKFLRNHNIACELTYHPNKKLGEQLQLAEKRGSYCAVILTGEDVNNYMQIFSESIANSDQMTDLNRISAKVYDDILNSLQLTVKRFGDRAKLTDKPPNIAKWIQQH